MIYNKDKTIQVYGKWLSVLMVLLPYLSSGQNKIEQIKHALTVEKNDSVRADLYITIQEYFSYSNADSAYFYVEKGLKEFEEKRNDYGIATMYSLLGSLDNKHGRLASAKKRQMLAQRMFTAIHSTRGIAKTNSFIGVIEAKRGNLDLATSYCLKALKLYKEIGHKVGMANVYVNLGSINDDLGSFEKAMNYYKSGIAILEGTDEIATLCNLYNNLGILYGKKGDLGTAKLYFQKALNRSDQQEYINAYLYSMLNLGILHQISGDNKSALQFFNDALQIAIDKDLPDEQAKLLVNKSGITGADNPQAAIKELEQALGISKRLGDKALLNEIYLQLLEIYKAENNYKQISNIYEEQKKIMDSLFGIEKVKEVANLESVYELEQANANFKELQLKHKSDELKRNILLLVAVSLIIIVVIVMVFYRKTRALNKELQVQKTDLTTSNDTKDKLFSIIGHDLRGPVGTIPVVLDMLEDSSLTDEERIYLKGSLKSQALSVSATLDTLLFWGKSHMKGSTLLAEPFAAAAHVTKNIELLNIQAKQKQIAINNETEEMRLYGIAAHFDFIIRNLLANAIKYTPEGGKVSISMDKHVRTGFAVYAVKDTGVGISVDNQVNIFEPSYVSERGTSGETGSGIGLMLCKEFVIENGGEIWFESEQGKGTTFYFCFKLA